MGRRTLWPLALGAAFLMIGTAPLAGAGEAPRPGSVKAVAATAESALLVTGLIDVDAAGNVLSFSLYHTDALPAGVVRMANENIPSWRFEPVELAGGTKASRMYMAMLFVATRTPEGHLRVELRHPVFWSVRSAPAIRLVRSANDFTYPALADRSRVGATVHTVLRFDRAGTITDVMVEQVNLTSIDTEAGMTKWRDLFAKAVLRDIRKARMEVPEGAFADGQPTMVGRFAFRYVFEEGPRQEPGKWFTYIPGPRARVPWPDAVTLTWSAPDALAPDQLQTHDPDVRRLVTPAAQGATQ